MPEDHFSDLVADIRAHGLRQPVVVFEGKIIDGWHRYRACFAAGVEPHFEALATADPVAFVLSANMHRRHLTGSQRAAAVVACSEWAEVGHNQHSGGSEPGSDPQTPRQCSELATESKMAEAAGVSERTIRHAKRAHEAGLGDAVRDGKVTAKHAAELAKLPEPERAAALEAPATKPVKAAAGMEQENAELRARVQELQGQVDELSALLEEAQRDLEAAQRTLDAEDLLDQFRKEIHRAHETARIASSRSRGLMNENADLAKRLKSALRKIERLEKVAA
jgi:hypothetical protein